MMFQGVISFGNRPRIGNKRCACLVINGKCCTCGRLCYVISEGAKLVVKDVGVKGVGKGKVKKNKCVRRLNVSEKVDVGEASSVGAVGETLSEAVGTVVNGVETVEEAVGTVVQGVETEDTVAEVVGGVGETVGASGNSIETVGAYLDFCLEDLLDVDEV
jgi:hypothetical protein